MNHCYRLYQQYVSNRIKTIISSKRTNWNTLIAATRRNTFVSRVHRETSRTMSRRSVIRETRHMLFARCFPCVSGWRFAIRLVNFPRSCRVRSCLVLTREEKERKKKNRKEKRVALVESEYRSARAGARFCRVLWRGHATETSTRRITVDRQVKRVHFLRGPQCRRIEEGSPVSLSIRCFFPAVRSTASTLHVTCACVHRERERKKEREKAYRERERRRYINISRENTIFFRFPSSHA